MTKFLQSIFYTSSSENPVGKNPGYDSYTGFKNATIEVSDFWICVAVAVVLGVLVALCYMYKNEFCACII